MSLVEIASETHEEILALGAAARERGVETHLYVFGKRTPASTIVRKVLRAGTPVEHAAMTQPDYGAAAVAMQPLLAAGHQLLGELHKHPDDYIGPSSGDRQMLLNIPPEKFPNYLCMVLTFRTAGPPIITAHSVRDGEIVEHEVRVIANGYPALLPSSTEEVTIFAPGAGSGGCLTDLQLAKLGVRAIKIADHDAFEERNLTRHLADNRATGKSKAKYLAKFLTHRTTTKITPLSFAITPATTDDLDHLVAQHTFTVNNTGHPPTSILISRSCAKGGKVCIHAGAFARGSGGFVFLQTPDGPCYECLYDLQRNQASDDPATLEALATQYGYTDEDLRAHIGLWTDVNLIASVQAKVVLEFLKHGQLKDNLWVIDNDRLSITARRVQRHAECITCQPTEAA
jgi:molybdopterin/thiamine biosynthesis adenylyltransferase